MSDGANDKFPRDETFALKYKVEVGEFKADDKKPLEGLTDALVLVSMVFPKDGSLSSMLMSIDGRKDHGGKALSALDIFKAWAIMSKSLTESDDLPQELRTICLNAFEAYRALILAANEDG